ncbi:MAG: FAD:protein FMN transferase [Planctomycetaceae bacterium]
MSGQDTRRDFLAGRALLRLADRAGADVPERIAPSAGPTVRIETRAMACPWSVVMNPGPPEQVMAASDSLDLVHPIEQLLSIYRDDSSISQVKRLQPGEVMELPREVVALLGQCQEFSRQTGGAFDPTSGRVIRLWRECRQAGRIPDQSEIDEALWRTALVSDVTAGEAAQHSGISRLLELDHASSTIRVLAPGVEIDLGAIGKGYAIDRICEALLPATTSPGTEAQSIPTHYGVANFLLHGGFSSLRAHGTHHGHEGWPVGLRNPLFPDRNYATLLLKDRALATSGSNVQFFRHQGQRYGHILDPRTGWPVEGMLSVTVTAPTATEADALSTAFYVMGLEAAADYCRQHPEIGAILVPPLKEGRTLTPLILNIAEDELFFGDDVAVDT